MVEYSGADDEVELMVQPRDFRAGERIVAGGAPGDAIDIIRDGEARVPIVYATGRVPGRR